MVITVMNGFFWRIRSRTRIDSVSDQIGFRTLFGISYFKPLFNRTHPICELGNLM